MNIKMLKYDSYIKMIKNSVGTKMFRNLYLEIDNKKIDATKNGNFSCAFFVSNILLIWGLISNGHANVLNTIKDMKKNGWKKISKDKIRPGDVIVWDKRVSSDGLEHYHNGFYIGNKKAISHNDTKKSPIIHNWKTYINGNGQKKKIIAVYNYSKFK